MYGFEMFSGGLMLGLVVAQIWTSSWFKSNLNRLFINDLVAGRSYLNEAHEKMLTEWVDDRRSNKA
jgi:hypothetical protein